MPSPPKLKDLLADKFPEWRHPSDKYSDERINYGRLAMEIGTSRQNIHSSVHIYNSISAKNARSLIDHPLKRVTAEDLLPYIS